MSQSELARLLRASAAASSAAGGKLSRASNFDDSTGEFNSAAARRSSLKNKRNQADDFAAPFNKQTANANSELNGFGPMDMGNFDSSPNSNARSSLSRNSNNDDDDDGDAPNFAANFDSNDDPDAASNADNSDRPMRLNQAASGRPDSNDDSSNDGNGFGPPAFDGSEFNGADEPSSDFASSGRLRQAGSSANGRKRFNSADDEDSAGIPAYNPGPNSAVNANDDEDDAPRGAAPTSKSFATDNANNNNDDDDD